METNLYKNLVIYVYSIIERFDQKCLNDYIDFFKDTSEYFNKRYPTYYTAFLNDLNDYSQLNRWDNFLYIENDRIMNRVFINHILRNLNTFFEIIDDGKYFSIYSKYAKNSLVYDFISVFYHVTFRGNTFHFTISIIKKFYTYCIDNNLHFLATDLAARISELYYSTHDFKNYNKFVKYFDGNLSNYSELIRIKNFMEGISLKYTSVVYVESNKLDEIYKWIVYYDAKPETNVYTQYYLNLLTIEYYYYRDIDHLEKVLNDFLLFLKVNKNVLDKNIYDSGFLNYLVHKFLLRPELAIIKQFEELLIITLNISFFRITILINLIQMSIILQKSEIFYTYKSEIYKYENSPVFKSYFSLLKYFIATHHHLSANYKDSQLALNDASALLTDKSGFGLGIRMLEIFNFIKSNNLDQVEVALLNLKNHITLLKKGGMIKPRYLYIYKILVKLHSCGYNYKETFRLHKEKLHQMNGDLRDYAWEFRGPELIRFDLWFFDEAGFLPPWNLNDPRLPKALPNGANSPD